MSRLGLKQFLFAAGFLFVAGAVSGAQAQGQYGALALAPDGAYGYAYNYATIDLAQDTAISECSKHGKGCNVVRVFENACVAFASSKDGNNLVANWVSGYDTDERPRRVLRACRNDGGQNCQVRAEFCTGKGR